MLKKLTALILTLFCIAAVQVAFAQVSDLVINRDILDLDDNLADTSTVQLAKPEKIYLTKFESDNPYLTADSEDWYAMMYYYFITELGYADIPVHYLIDNEGFVYEGYSGGPTAIPELSNPEPAIIIGYMDDGTPRRSLAIDAMSELVTELSEEYGISQEEVSAVELIPTRASTGSLAKSQLVAASSQAFDEAIANADYSEDDSLSYSGSVEVATSEISIPLGGTGDVILNVTNTGENPWFTFNDFIYASTLDGEDSDFYVNNVWDSFSRPNHIEDLTIASGESTELTIQLQAPFEEGEFTESFQLIEEDGTELEGSEFSVQFTTEPGDVDVVRVTETGFGFLNVRSAPTQGAEIVSQVSVDELFRFDEVSESGWYRIEYTDGEFGWATGVYLEEL